MRVLWILEITLLCGCSSLPAWGQASPANAVDSAQQALESRRNLPWYNAEEDELERIDVEPNEDDWKRQSDWAASDRSKPRSAFRIGPLFASILRTLAWIGLALLVGLVIWALVWAMTRREMAIGDTEGVVSDVEAASRVEDLPVPVSPKHTDLLAAAQAYFNTGDLGQAIIYAFAHQLVELDKHHLIQLTKGKTNREYLNELRAHPRFVELLRPTMLAFEDVFFGHHEISRQRFQACWEDLDHFHQQLEQVAL